MKKREKQLILSIIVLGSKFPVEGMSRLLSHNQIKFPQRVSLPITFQKRVPWINSFSSNAQYPSVLSKARSSVAPFLFSAATSLAVTNSGISTISKMIYDLKNIWDKSKNYLSFLNRSKKLTFAETYHNGQRTLRTAEELISPLGELANIGPFQTYLLDQHYESEEQFGNEQQALTSLFGNIYLHAKNNARTLADVELLYEAAIEQSRLRIETGLENTLDDVKTEFARIAEKENEMVNLYDEDSIPIVKKYLSDMKTDLYNQFVEWFTAHEKINISRNSSTDSIS